MTTLPSFAGRVREWPVVSFPLLVLSRFFRLELLERSFGLAAQAFVAHPSRGCRRGLNPPVSSRLLAM